MGVFSLACLACISLVFLRVLTGSGPSVKLLHIAQILNRSCMIVRPIKPAIIKAPMNGVKVKTIVSGGGPTEMLGNVAVMMSTESSDAVIEKRIKHARSQ